MSDFGIAVGFLRLLFCCSREELSRRANLSVGSIARIEQGRPPRGRTLEKIRQAFGLSTASWQRLLDLIADFRRERKSGSSPLGAVSSEPLEDLLSALAPRIFAAFAALPVTSLPEAPRRLQGPLATEEKPVPPLAIALYYFRKIASVSRKEFGRPFRLTSKTISEYESGHRSLPRARTERYIEPHGFGPQALDEVLSDIATRRGEISPEGTLPLPPGELRILGREQREISSFLAAELARLRRLDKARADHAQAGELFEQLAACKPKERRRLVMRGEECRLWALSVRFGEESAKAAPDSAARAVEFAMLSLRLAKLAPAPPKFRRLLRGQAWAFLANGRRVAGGLPTADKEFARSSRLWQEGEGGDPDHLLDHTRRFELEASLRTQQDRLDDALALLDRALAEGPEAAAGRVLLQKALALELCGQQGPALDMLEQAEGHFGPEADRRLVLVLRHNQAVCYCHLGRFAEAAALVPTVRALAIELRNRIDLMHVLWLEARTLAGVGRAEEAVVSLEQVRKDLVAGGIAYDAALAALELSALHLEQGNPRAARELAVEITPLLSARQVPRDLLAALSLFVQALEQERATAAAAREILHALERCRPVESTPSAESR